MPASIRRRLVAGRGGRHPPWQPLSARMSGDRQRGDSRAPRARRQAAPDFATIAGPPSCAITASPRQQLHRAIDTRALGLKPKLQSMSIARAAAPGDLILSF
jgi:hypothetical protein